MNLGAETRLKAPAELVTMAEIGVDMLHRALDAFVGGKPDQARALPKEDDRVDALFNVVQPAILKQMHEDPGSVDQLNHLLWACHNLERFADRVINICERTVFIATGEMLEFDVTDDEKRLA
jgi:phosphate transport system protein